MCAISQNKDFFKTWNTLELYNRMDCIFARLSYMQKRSKKVGIVRFCLLPIFKEDIYFSRLFNYLTATEFEVIIYYFDCQVLSKYRNTHTCRLLYTLLFFILWSTQGHKRKTLIATSRVLLRSIHIWKPLFSSVFFFFFNLVRT